MMRRAFGLLAGLGAVALLGGCNETTGSAGPAMSTPMAPSAYHLPPGAPCTNEIDEYHAIVKADQQTGNVEQKVYDQIDHELSRAADACSAGMGGQAHSIVAASKARHGYRV